jgi:hypothetical protein
MVVQAVEEEIVEIHAPQVTEVVVETQAIAPQTQSRKASAVGRHVSYFVDAVLSTLFLFLAMAWFYKTFPDQIKSNQAVFLTLAVFPMYFPRPASASVVRRLLYKIVGARPVD